MIAWGYGIFENTNAMEWVDDLDDYDDTGILYDTLKKAAEYIDSGELDLLKEPYGSEALAAAEIVAAIFGKKSSDLPTDAVNWIKKIQKPDNDNIIKLALIAVEAVQYNSHIKNYRYNKGEDEIWHILISQLKKRLRVKNRLNIK